MPNITVRSRVTYIYEQVLVKYYIKDIVKVQK